MYYPTVNPTTKHANVDGAYCQKNQLQWARSHHASKSLTTLLSPHTAQVSPKHHSSLSQPAMKHLHAMELRVERAPFFPSCLQQHELGAVHRQHGLKHLYNHSHFQRCNCEQTCCHSLWHLHLSSSWNLVGSCHIVKTLESSSDNLLLHGELHNLGSHKHGSLSSIALSLASQSNYPKRNCSK